jgi:tripartite ATP-independent transporter DctP family solute receptor
MQVLKYAAVSLAAVGMLLAGSAKAQEKHVTIRMAHTLPATDPVGMGAQRFADLVKQLSHGSISVAIFPNNQLGGENEVLQQEKQGSIQMVVSGAGTLGNMAPDISVLEAPYIWKDWNSEKKVLSGPIFQHFQQELSSGQGLQLLSATWYYGRRNLTCNKLIRTPADAAGLKIRTPPSPVNLLSAEVLGGKGVPMNFPQVYLALKTGTIDCEENPLPTIFSGKLYEVQKYIMLTHHIQQSQIVTMNLGFWKSLSDAQRKAVQQAVDEAGTYEAELGQKAEADVQEKLSHMPETQVVPTDVTPFVANARKLDPSLKASWGDYYDRILKAQE